MSKDYMEDRSLSEKWKFRFSFFDEHGFPGFWSSTPEYKKALKTLNSRQRITIQCNFFAVFFTVIYLLILGLWKKAIIVFVLAFIVAVIAGMVGIGALSIAVNVYVGMNANKWFYEKEVKGIHNWSL